MFGFVSLLVMLAIVAGVVVWVRRARTQTPAGAGHLQSGESRGRISLLTEAIGYIGAILVLAGGGAAIGQQWESFGTPARLATLGGATLAFLIIGAFTRSSAEPAFKRLTSVTWAISVAGFAGTAVVLNQFYDARAEVAFVTTATASTAYAVVLWALHSGAIQHAITFGGLLASAASILTWAIHDPSPWMIATPMWGIGVAWVALGWTRRISPWWMAVPLGLLVALIAPANMNVDPAVYTLGIGTAGAVMALSVLGRFTPGLAIGAVGMLGYVVGAVTHYFSDTIGVPAALAITGLLILVLGAVVARLLRITSRPGSGGAPGTAEERHDHPARHAA